MEAEEGLMSSSLCSRYFRDVEAESGAGGGGGAGQGSQYEWRGMPVKQRVQGTDEAERRMEEAESAERLREATQVPGRPSGGSGWGDRWGGQPRARTCPSFLFSMALGSRQEHSSRMSQDMGNGIT